MKLFQKYLLCFFIVPYIISCGSGGGSDANLEIPSAPQPPNLSISISDFPSKIYSYDRLEISITSNYPECKFFNIRFRYSLAIIKWKFAFI
jgi:hypothetical protein